MRKNPIHHDLIRTYSSAACPHRRGPHLRRRNRRGSHLYPGPAGGAGGCRSGGCAAARGAARREAVRGCRAGRVRRGALSAGRGAVRADDGRDGVPAGRRSPRRRRGGGLRDRDGGVRRRFPGGRRGCSAGFRDRRRAAGGAHPVVGRPRSGAGGDCGRAALPALRRGGRGPGADDLDAARAAS